MAKFFTRFDRCIYCGSTDQLTREHAIPRGLTSGLTPWDLFNERKLHEMVVLKRASCEECRRVTHAFEDICLHQMWGDWRTSLGLRRKDRRPDTTRVLFANPSAHYAEVDPSRLPAAVVLPLYNRASIQLGNGPPDPLVRGYGARLLATGAYWGGDVEHHSIINHYAFQQMLAKIAFCFAVASVGTDAFLPLVTDFIRGREPAAVGKYIEGYPAFNVSGVMPMPLITLHVRKFETGNSHRLVVFIRLFEFAGYAVFVGDLKEDIPSIGLVS